MVGIRISVHPLFYVFGLFYALTGKFLTFIIYTISAVVHELGHSLSAERQGYRLNKMVLMPFGAVVVGKIDDMKLFDQIKIALSGPIVNLCVAVLFVSLWWIFPNTYAYTDSVVVANLGLAVVNLIPAKPLDGGRVLYSIVVLRWNEKRASLIVKTVGVIFATLLLGLFILSIVYNNINISILMFAVVILIGSLEKNNKSKYIRLYSNDVYNRLIYGLPVKRQAVNKDMTLKRLIGLLDVNAVNEIDVYDGELLIGSLSQDDISRVMETSSLYSNIGAYVN